MANTTTNTRAKSDVQNTATHAEEASPIVVKDIDPNQYVTVRNGFQGKLIYKSKHTGEVYKWSEFGDEQDMELKELKAAKSSNKKMFINNYFLFDEDWIIDYLGVSQYYQHSLRIDEFDDFFNKTPAELKKAIAAMPDGQKKSISYRARQLILDGNIDSRKTIAALEEALGVELIEK